MSLNCGGRIGAGGIWDMIVKLGVPRLDGGAAVRAMAEAITLVRALSGGGDPVTFDGRVLPRIRPGPGRESRPRVDAAAVAAGRDPAEIVSVYNFGGRITPDPLAATRDEDGRWIGGSVRQWVDELTTAVLEHHAAGFIYRGTLASPSGTTS